MSHHDVDGDGYDEILISLDQRFVTLNQDGTILWQNEHQKKHSDYILFGDVTGDGDVEVVYGHETQRPIVAADGQTGEIRQTWQDPSPGHLHLQRATLGDFHTGLRGLELVAVGERGTRAGLIEWDSDGELVWRKKIPTRWVSKGDWDGNGRVEILKWKRAPGGS